ncbi:MAG: TonB-dependent receptor [Chitinophagaceae bacterium]
MIILKRLLPICLSCMLFFSFPKTQAQNLAGKVEGSVSSMLNYPLIGAVVTARLHNKVMAHTLTDSTGKFTIAGCPPGVYDFTVSHVGYAPQILTGYSVRANETTTLVVQLAEITNNLNEVVVIGYGTVRKKDLTGSVSSIKEDAFSNRAILSFADAIKGKAAGVQITQNDGAPGSESTIRIRGASSVSASSAPLYVIDGIMQDSTVIIDPGDVESVNILKDASSTAIYGSRGANGVVIITTKSGKSGKTIVEFYNNTGFQKPAHLYKLMNSTQYEYTKYLTNFVYSPASSTDADEPASTSSGYTYYRDSPLGTDGGFWGVPTAYSNWQSYDSPDSTNTDWQKAVFQKGIIQDYHVSASGGNANTKYSLQFGYFNQNGIIVFSGYKRYNGRLNLSQKLSSSVNLIANLSTTQTETNGYISSSQDVGITSNPVISSVLYQPPVNPLTYTDLEDNSDVDGYVTTNPYSLAKYVTNQKKVNQQMSRIGINWTINKNFSFQTTGSYTNAHSKFSAYYPKTVTAGYKYNGRAIIINTEGSDIMNENILSYKGKIGSFHSFNAMAGATFERNINNSLTSENRDFEIESLGVGGIENGTEPQNPIYYVAKWTMASFLGRFEYSYMSKYLATATFRADGSSRFSTADKWGYFPSVALAWVASSEPFIKNIKAISNLKFRASIGQSGNTAIPPYLTLSTISTAFAPIDGTSTTYGVVVDRAENLSLKWETTTQYDGGLDLKLFKDRVSFTVDWYLKRTKNLLIQKPTPAYSGYTTTWTNFGSIQNEGLEFDLSGIIINGSELNWSLNANFGLNKAKAIDVGGELDLDPGIISSIGTTVVLRNGEPLGEWYGYKINGVFHSEAELTASGLTSINGTSITSVAPGTVKFVDANKDGIIDASDRTVIGKGQPDFTGGLTSNLDYKGFNLSIGIQYSYGNKIYNANRVPAEASINTDNLQAKNANAWSPDLYDMTTGELVQKGNTGSNIRMPGRLTSALLTSDFIEDGSYIRISDITLSYSIKKSIIEHIGLQNILLFISGKNLFLWTKYSGYDPEVNTQQGGFGSLMPSLDYAAYPRSKIFSIGLKASF